MQMCLQQFSETYFRGRDAKRERKKKNHTGKNQLMRLMNISIVLGNGRCHDFRGLEKEISEAPWSAGCGTAALSAVINSILTYLESY